MPGQSLFLLTTKIFGKLLTALPAEEEEAEIARINSIFKQLIAPF